MEQTEIEEWIEKRRPETTSAERDLLHRYSLGVPLLLERMMQNAPATPEIAKMALATYISGIAKSHHLFGGNTADFRQNVIAFFAEHLRKPPQDLPWEIVHQSLRKNNDPLEVIHKSRADHTLPLCAGTVDRYREWTEIPDETFVNIFIPSTQGKTREMMDDLGLNEHDIVDNYEGRLKAFNATGRKVAFFRTATTPYEQPIIRGCEGRGLNARFLNMFLRANNIGSCNPYAFDSFGDRSGEVVLAPGADPFLLTSYDHEGLHRNPLCIGLGTETYLQHKGLVY